MVQYVEAVLFEMGDSDADVDEKGIIFVAIRMIGLGPNGDQVSFKFTPNTLTGTGQRQHGKYWEIIIGFDSNMYTLMEATDVEEGIGTGKALVQDDKNTAISLFRISVLDNAGTTVTWTWAMSTTFVANPSQRLDNMNQGPNSTQAYECKFLSRGIMTPG